MANKKGQKQNVAEHRIAHAIDDLAEFENFKENIIPSIRRDLKKGVSAEEIYKKYSSMAAARGITIALTDRDSGKALAAIKDILDRDQGKAKERKDVTHRMDNAKEEDIDAALLSKLDTFMADEEEKTKH